MSRIGKKPITIPNQVALSAAAGVVTVKGPLGTLSRAFKEAITITIGEKEVILAPARETVETRALWGTYASHLDNMITGVTRGYEKRLLIEGVGYRAQLTGANLTLNLGFSHPVVVPVPEGLKVAVDKNVITITGVDKDLVGEFAARIRALKKPEPYKGKGIRYEFEVVRRKEGKKVVA
jgi:large subunit ribosomal protein L6